MSLMDPESMMFQTDWSVLEDWFARRAVAAGHSVYEHSETVSVGPAISDEINQTGIDMSYRLGQDVAKIFED